MKAILNDAEIEEIRRVVIGCKHEEEKKNIQRKDAIHELEFGCAVYHKWCAEGKSGLSGSEVAYELVAYMENALSNLKGVK